MMHSKLSANYYILILIAFTSGCCEQELSGRYLLSDYEKSLIPFTGFKNITYQNENGQDVVASTQPRTIELGKDQPGPESCEYWEYETMNNFINFFSSGFSIQLDLTSNQDSVNFGLSYVVPDSVNSENEFFTSLRDPSEQQAVNISLKGFEFKDVFVFDNPYNGKVELILYSSKGKGVELIGFSDGTYLKLK